MRKKRKLVVLDMETDPFEYMCIPHVFLAGIFDGENYKYWWGDDAAERCADYIRVNNYKVYAHNGGKFDYFYLLPELFNDEHVKKVKIISNRLSKIEFGNSVLLDSYNILPLALSAFKKDDISYNKFKRDVREQHKNEIIEYWKGDCRYLYEWVTKFIERFGEKLTIASAAFDQLDKMGYPSKMTTGLDYDETFRHFYFGGRTQAFKKGFMEGDYKVYDINAAYARAMIDDHPLGSRYFKQDNLKELPDNKVYFAQILAESYGALPYHKLNSKGTIIETCFPDDGNEREFFATSWEIRAGLRTKTLKINKVLSAYIHEETKSFENYIMRFHKEKKLGKETKDKALETFAKLMNNSAYGKFGQDGTKFREHRFCRQGEYPLLENEIEESKLLKMTEKEYLDYFDFQLHNYNEFGFALWSKPDPKEQFFNVAVAASITGYVRAYLWESINKAVDPIYCDTDSIICRKLNVNLSNELGDWKLEGETNEGVYIGGKKLYALKTNELDNEGNKIEKISSKGARLSYKQIVDMVKYGKTIEWKNEAPTFSLKRGTHFVNRRLKST